MPWYGCGLGLAYVILGWIPAPIGAGEKQDGCRMGWARSPSLLSYVWSMSAFRLG